MARFPSVGEDFGGYRITRQLGRGGMGVVFAAEQIGLGRTIALKVLSPEFAEQHDYRTRFAREASVLARLDSPHVIQVYDHGEHDGCLYIATQYVAGGDLSQALAQHGPVPAAQAAQVGAQVAWALTDSHAAGIVHRDLKPSNVLLRGVSSEVFVYLCDFGIAQDRAPGLTATGAVAGTFAYLAPERLRGEPATPAADIYALGCVLWTAIIGSSPYAGSDVEIGMSHLNAPIPRLTANSPVASAVNDVLSRAMAKEPAQRYPGAAAMRSDLQELARLAQGSHPPLVPLTPPAGSAPGPRPSGPPPGSRPSQPSQPSHPSNPSNAQGPVFAGGFAPPPPPGSWGPPSGPGQQPPRRNRTPLIVAGAVAAVLVVTGGVAAVALNAGDDGEPEARSSSSSTSDPTTTTDVPTTTTTPPPTTTTPPPEPPDPPDPPEPKPFYPDVAPSTGLKVELGLASLRAPAGWGRIDDGIVSQGVGARDYSDYEGYYSSVFIRRTKPAFPLTSIDLLEITAKAFAESLAENDDSIELVKSAGLKRAWLDGQQAARVGAVYRGIDDDLYFREETWFAQRGKYLYRVTFQHSRVDSDAERRGQIDPMVVSFRWK